jgi:hypothetical protein
MARNVRWFELALGSSTGPLWWQQGDTNGDNRVDEADLAAFMANLDRAALEPAQIAEIEAFAAVAHLSTPIPGDANLDGVVAYDDYLAVKGNYGKRSPAYFCDGDFNADRSVDSADLAILLANLDRDMLTAEQLADVNAFAAQHPAQ